MREGGGERAREGGEGELLIQSILYLSWPITVLILLTHVLFPCKLYICLYISLYNPLNPFVPSLYLEYLRQRLLLIILPLR